MYDQVALREQEFNEQRVPARDVALKHYHLSNKAVDSFLAFCLATMHDRQPIHGYAILHQLFYGRLILKNCSYGDRWRKLIKKII